MVAWRSRLRVRVPVDTVVHLRCRAAAAERQRLARLVDRVLRVTAARGNRYRARVRLGFLLQQSRQTIAGGPVRASRVGVVLDMSALVVKLSQRSAHAQSVIRAHHLLLVVALVLLERACRRPAVLVLRALAGALSRRPARVQPAMQVHRRHRVAARTRMERVFCVGPVNHALVDPRSLQRAFVRLVMQALRTGRAVAP